MKRVVDPDDIVIPALHVINESKIVDGETFAAGVPDGDLNHIGTTWDLWQRVGQNSPPGDWTVWLMLAGRGFGKTRTGAEWLRQHVVRGDRHTRLALVGATAADARTVMVEGDSGILATAPASDRPIWEPSLGRLIWANGTQAYVYSAEAPDRLRGPQFSAAWCDELAAWPHTTATETWNNLRFTLRIGPRPRLVATTTPRPTRFVRDVMALSDTVVTGGRTHDNPVLAASFVQSMIEAYGGTFLGRQELDGEMLIDCEEALWTRAGIEASRIAAAPPLVRVVVGVDPSGSTGGDACGIVVAGVDAEGTGYLIEDATVAGLHPDEWTRAVARAAADHRAECVVAETNYGGAMVDSVLRAADRVLPLKTVHATRGKAARAEPVAMLYRRGLVRHVGSFPGLEDELCGMMTTGPYTGPGRSPDRADALVWAITELMLGAPAPEPRVRVL